MKHYRNSWKIFVLTWLSMIAFHKFQNWFFYLFYTTAWIERFFYSLLYERLIKRWNFYHYVQIRKFFEVCKIWFESDSFLKELRGLFRTAILRISCSKLKYDPAQKDSWNALILFVERICLFINALKDVWIWQYEKCGLMKFGFLH